MRRNTTGVPRTADYMLGRGKLMFAELDGSYNPKGFRDLGNVTDFKITAASEELAHETSRSGMKVEDLRVVLKRSGTWTAVLDSAEADNVALFLSGAVASITNPAVAGFAEHAMVTSVELGRWYPIVNSSGVRAMDIDKTKLTLEKSGSPDVALVEGTDYEVNEALGMVFLLSSASNIAAGDTLDVTLAADAGANPIVQVRGLTQTTLRGALMFCGVNPNTGKEYEILLPNTNVEGDGDLALISDEWVTMPIKGGISKSDSTRYTASPYVTFASAAA